MDTKFKPGDKVVLERWTSPNESVNWAKERLKQGGEYTIKRSWIENLKEWIRLEEDTLTHPADKFEKVQENKYTLEYCKGKRIAVNVHNEEQFDRVMHFIRKEGHRYQYTMGSHYGDNLCLNFQDGCHCNKSYYLENGYGVIDFSQLNFDEKMKKIIGYKAPYDLFGGDIKKGTVYPVFETTDRTKEFFVPLEIVKTWEPVYEEEKIMIGKYEASFKDKGYVAFGCQSYTKEDVRFLYNLISSSEVGAKVEIHGTKMTPDLLSNIIKQIK